MINLYGLKPCPFCGNHHVVDFLNAFVVVVRCQSCGATIRDNAAVMMYHKDNVPEKLRGVKTYEPNGVINSEGVTFDELGYKAVAVGLTIAAHGIKERWNLRHARP